MKIFIYILIIVAVIFLYKKYQWCQANKIASGGTCGFFSIGNTQPYLYYGVLDNPFPPVVQ